MKEEEGNGASANRVSFYKLYAFADSTDKALMISGTIGAVGNGLCMPLMTIFFGELTDVLGQNQNTKNVAPTASQVCVKMLYLAIGVAVAAFLQVACWMVTGERQAARIRNLYLKTILRQDIAFFDKEANTGEVIERMSRNSVLLQDAMGEKVGKFIQLMSAFIGGFAVAFVKGSLLTLVLLSCIPLLATVAAIMTITISRAATRGQTAYGKAAAVVEQTISSIRTVVSFTGEKQAVADYNKAIVSAYKSGVVEGLAAGTGLGAFSLGIFFFYALAIWFGARLILDGHYTGGTVINVIIAVLAGSKSLGQAAPCISAFAAGQAAGYKMFETFKRKPAIDPYNPGGIALQDIRGDIELRDVYFGYPTRETEQIFRGFSLSISSGKTAALVGPSGSGKSTVISLIERFYDPDAGQVLIDGINLKDFQLRWIRQKIALVSQEPVLFTSSIKDNIAYGKVDATIEEITAAAEIANAAKFIKDLPEGLDSLVGEHGTQLSGGQKQRVAIARALLKNPRILLLDEATSALDAESERTVKEALDRIMVNRTTVIVAHSLSTVRNADVIAVIQQGRVVEEGPHSELIKHPEGVYARLVHSQEMRPESEQTASFGKFPGQASLRVLSLKPEKHDMAIEVENYITALDRESASPKQPSQVSMKRLAALNKPEIPLLLVGSLSAVCSGCIQPSYSILLASSITMFYRPPHELRDGSRFTALMFLVLGVASLLTNLAQTYCFSVAGCKLVQRVREMCFERIVHMEVGWFDDADNSTGAIGARLSTDAARLSSLTGDALSFLVRNIATLVACFLIAFLANWKLSFIVLLMLPIVALNVCLQMRFLKGFSTDAKKKYEEATQVARDAVGSIRTVASFCAEEYILQLYEMKCEDPRRTGVRQGLISGMGFGMSFFVLYCVLAATFYVAAQLLDHGETTYTDMYRVFLALTLAAVAISQSSSFAPDISKSKAAAATLFSILDHKSRIDTIHNESPITLDDVKGEIELQHVSFTYPTRPDVHIFRSLCLTVPAGKTVALVGESGSGKSTVISLLQRFYDPQSGCVTIDGIEIHKFQLKWLRQQMGLVSQEPVLFNDTIRANIAYGKGGEATEAEIIAAAKLANVHNFISSMLQGYDTVVGERGVQLSGGQKQRVAIARAIVKEPRILLLDEATSALDAESERIVQEALDRVVVNRTTVVIAHRLSTIRNADMIAVVKNGVIAEQGNHDNLVSITDGAYASLVALQTSAQS